MNNKSCLKMLSDLQNYKEIKCRTCIKYKENIHSHENPGLYFYLYVCEKCIYVRMLKTEISDFIQIIKESERLIDNFMNKYSTVLNIISKINNCKNKFWKAELLFDYNGEPEIHIDQIYINTRSYYLTFEKVKLSEENLSNRKNIIHALEKSMNRVIRNIECYGFRVMEVAN